MQSIQQFICTSPTAYGLVKYNIYIYIYIYIYILYIYIIYIYIYALGNDVSVIDTGKKIDVKITLKLACGKFRLITLEKA